MTTSESTFLPIPDVWGIGRVPTSAGVVWWPSTREERLSAAEHARRRLEALGIAAGELVIITSMMDEGVQVTPFEDTLRLLGALLVPADATLFDASRVVSFVERFSIKYLIGVGEQTIDGITELQSDLAVLSDIRVLVARPDSYVRLADAGLSPLRWLTLGSTVAIECLERSGAHANGDAWEVLSLEGEIVLAARGKVHPEVTRALDDRGRLHTGITGAVIDRRCRCGSDDPRVLTS